MPKITSNKTLAGPAITSCLIFLFPFSFLSLYCSPDHFSCPCLQTKVYQFYQYTRTFLCPSCLAHTLLPYAILQLASLPGDLIRHKPSEEKEMFAKFFWRYIQLRDDISYYSNLSIIDSWERTVRCLFCNAMATLKPTMTRRIMLRCNICGALVFANGIILQQRIQTLRDFVFRPLL